MPWGRRRPVEHHDWRFSASEEDLREYDAFGPWLYDVKAERDIPGDERSYLVALAPAGRAFVRHLDEQRRRGFERLFAAMAPDDVAAAVKGVDLITGYLRKMEEDNGMGPQAPSRAP